MAKLTDEQIALIDMEALTEREEEAKTRTPKGHKTMIWDAHKVMLGVGENKRELQLNTEAFPIVAEVFLGKKYDPKINVSPSQLRDAINQYAFNIHMARQRVAQAKKKTAKTE